MPEEATVICRTPTPGKKPTRIAKWKYDLVRAAILKEVPRDPDSVEFRELPGLVSTHFSPEELDKLGSISWYTTTVKLNMEVEGEIERIPGSNPQRLRHVI